MISSLLKYSASYTLIEGIQKGGMFLLLPLLTHYMTTEEYGVVSSALIIISLLSIFFSLALNGSISRYYFKYENNYNNLRDFLGTIFLTLVIFVSFFSIILFFFGEGIFKLFFDELKFYPTIVFSILIVATQVIILAFITYLKTKRSLKVYSLIVTFHFVLQISLMVLFIIFMGFRDYGYILALLLSNIFIVLIIIFFLIKDINFVIKSKYIKEALSYSLPIIPIEFAVSINRLVERYFILLFIGLSGLGIYYIGFQIAGLISIISMAINSAYVPIFFKRYESNKEDLSEIYLINDIIVFIMSLVTAYSIMILPKLIFLLNPDYLSATDVIIYIGFTGALSTIYFINTNALSVELHLVKFKMISILLGTFNNVIIGYILTKNFGIIGAAISTLVGYFITTLVLSLIVKMKTNFKFDNKKYFFTMLFLFLFLYFIKDFNLILQAISLTAVFTVMFILYFKNISYVKSFLYQLKRFF